MSDIEAAFRPGTKVHGVFLVLRDCQWHCRECEYRQVEITQIAGGAGIQGLQRGEREQNAYTTMTDDDIRAKFQLLRKSNGSISHNLLKSRACERCFKTGKRGTPFGIVLFYEGDARWGPGDKTDPRGCVGCGWFDMSEWRKRLNSVLRKQREPK